MMHMHKDLFNWLMAKFKKNNCVLIKGDCAECPFSAYNNCTGGTCCNDLSPEQMADVVSKMWEDEQK